MSFHGNKWKIVGCSVKGQSHDICQDYFLFNSLNKDESIMIVSDGAGSYPGTEKGSEIISNMVYKKFKECKIDIDKIEDKEWRSICLSIVSDINTHIDLYAKENNLSSEMFCATLIVLIFNRSTLLAMHIGDGRAGYLNDDGYLLSAITPYTGEQAGETVFFNTEWATKHDNSFETRIIKDNISSVFAITDGMEQSAYECLSCKENGDFYDRNKPFDGFFRPIIQAFENIELDKLNDKIRYVLTSGSERIKNESDDKTMVIAVWQT